jgi:diguanylate cyclase (GGDEF)-like protein/PAS domain S-box-containing protein
VWFLQTKSLRLKLVLVSVVVEVVMLTMLVANSVWLVGNALDEDARLRVKMLAQLFNTVLVAPLAGGDMDSAKRIIDEALSKENLAYAVLFNDKGELLAGTEPIAAGASSYETWVSIEQQGKSYGRVRLGIPTDFLSAAKHKLVFESSAIAVAEVLLSLLLFLGLGYWLTNYLLELNEAGKAVASGDYSVRVPVVSSDEVGRLSTTFNVLAEAVQNQVKALKDGKATFRAIADYSYDWELWVDPEGKVVWVNPSVQRLTGYTPQECLEMTDFFATIVDPADEQRFLKESRLILGKRSGGGGLEFRVRRKDGSKFWAAANWQPIYGANGEYLGTRGSVRDITERKQAELQLQGTIKQLEEAQKRQHQYYAQAQKERAQLTALLTAMDMGVLFVGKEGVTYYNPPLFRVWGFPEDSSLSGKNTSELLQRVAKQLAHPEDYIEHVMQVIAAKENSRSYEFNLADGRTLLENTFLMPGEDGRYLGRLWVYNDVTQERRTAEQLVNLAERDALTNLYNRHRFQEELTRMLAEAERRNSTLGLLFFDLDEFKHINDTFGHRAGDAILIRVAGEMSAHVRRNEIFSRLGGDEFAILVPDVREDELEVLAERVVNTIPQIPFHFEGQNLRMTTSLGIAVFPDQAANAEELVAHADAAMYQAKDAGKNAWRIYSQNSDVSRQMLTRIAWNERIRNALRQNLLYLDFQGVYHANEGRLSHIEALVRMKDEANLGNVIMPVSFIPLAEKSGAILEIDRWVIQSSIALLASSSSVPPIAVNISGRSFDEPELPLFIRDELRKQDVSPKRLMVELTETSAVSDLHDAQRFIDALHETGCRVCLDDFGSGFSSFAYLKHLDVDVVKIDGLFIRNLPNDHDNQVFVKAIVDVARGMRKLTVAESVEDRQTLEMLKGFGVDMLQGYFLEAPRPDHLALTHV